MQYKAQIYNLPAYKPSKLIVRLAEGMTKLSSNENPLGASPLALEALRGSLDNIYRYPDAGVINLRSAIASALDLQPEMVACSNGSDEMVLLLCMAFLNEGDEAVMANGTFISYMLRTIEVGGRPVRVPLQNYTHDLNALADAITPRTKLLFVCNPNNPTGTSNSAAEVQALLERVPEDVLIVMDEAYVEFVSRADYPDMLAELRAGRKNLLVLRTFAKIYGLAGLRLGYALGNPELIGYLERARPAFNVNMLAQIAGTAAISDHEHVARSRAHAETERAFFNRELAALGITPIPSETNFVAFAVGDDMAVTEALMMRGFTVTPLGIWGLPGLIRVSFGLHDENIRFISALRDVLTQ